MKVENKMEPGALVRVLKVNFEEQNIYIFLMGLETTSDFPGEF